MLRSDQPHLMHKAAILFSSFGPYHVARIRALGEILQESGRELVAFRFTERSPTYGWSPDIPAKVPVVTLCDCPPIGGFAAWRLAKRFREELVARRIRAVFLPTYSPLPNLLCFLAAKSAGCCTILMTESWHGTEDATLPIRMLKHVLVRMFDTALVGGTPQRDYVASYGMPRDKIFVGYDVVDVEHFAACAMKWKSSTDLPIKGLPERYFLNLGRFVEKKNLATLVAAYARYAHGVADDGRSKMEHVKTPAALVLVGEGPLRKDLETQARELGLAVRDGVADQNPSGCSEVVLYPFQQVDLTPLFFARCEAFVLPSSREEWGLVINEAMACGAPVIVSNRAGCQLDLVKQGANGFSFDPEDAAGLSCLLGRFAKESDLRDRLGAEGARIIQDWKPERFGKEGFAAMESAVSACRLLNT